MEKLKFVKFWVSDWRAGTASLTPIERALYLELCAAIWETGEGVLVQRIPTIMPAATTDIMAAYEGLKLLGKVYEADGRALNRRSLAMHAEGIELRAARRKGAEEANRRKREFHERIEAEVDAGIRPPDAMGQRPAPADAFHAQYDERFQTFLAELKHTYPPHAGRSNWRRAAEGIVTLLNGGYTYGQIRSAVERKRAYHEAKGDTGTQFVPNPGTFFDDAENVDNAWTPPARERRPTRVEEAYDHNYETKQRLMEARGEHGQEREGRVRRPDSDRGGAPQSQIASGGG